MDLTIKHHITNMDELKRIYAEARKYDPDREDLQEAFASGARWAMTGKYYRPGNMFAAGTVTVTDAATPTFEEWWNAYQKKRGRKKAEAKWYKLSIAERQACMRATLPYVASTPDPIYRKDPLTYLNGECWNDEILTRQDNDHEQRRAERLAEKAARILGTN